MSCTTPSRTARFESRYLHSLVGAYPARQDLYRQRSPIHAVGRLSCPLILFQGREDKIVPPNQARRLGRGAGKPCGLLRHP